MRGRQNTSSVGGAITIDRRHVVLTEMPRGELAGLPAFMVDQPNPGRDGGRGGSVTPLVAVRTRRDAPPPASLPLFMKASSTSLLMPVAHGAGGGEYWIICDAPGGPSLRDSLPGSRIPSEGEIGTLYLRPLALALSRLQSLGLTHRGVRPDNLFRATDGSRILLGPGCLAPPAFAQPALYEPPSVAVCAPSARGPGTSADDVYALGVVLLELALGRTPLAGLDPEGIVRRKLELGSFQALAGAERLPPTLVSLLRTMLCDEPEGRPVLAALAESGIGVERPKPPRPEPRAPRPLMVNKTPVLTARMLARCFASQPIEALALLQAGAVDHWLRRALEQPAMAARIEEKLRNRDRSGDGVEQMVLMQLIAVLDPLAPVFWNGQWFWPDGAAGMLAAQLVNGGEDVIGSAIRQGALRRWSALTGRGGTMGLGELDRHNAHAARLPIPALRPAVLAYSLNPFLACTSPLLGGACVLQADQLVAALEAIDDSRPIAAARLLDGQMLALLAARSARSGEPEITIPADADERLLDLQALARAQLNARSGTASQDAPLAALPRLAARLLPAARERLSGWPGKGRRQRRTDLLQQAATAGDLVAMMELSCREEAWAADAAALQAAHEEAAGLRTLTRASLEAATTRARVAHAAGREVAVVAGILALLGAVTAGFFS